MLHTARVCTGLIVTRQGNHLKVDLSAPFGSRHHQQGQPDANPLCQMLLRASAEHEMSISGSQHPNLQPQLPFHCLAFTHKELRLHVHQPQLDGDGNSKEILFLANFMTKNHPNSLPNITVLLSESHQIHPLSFRAGNKE